MIFDMPKSACSMPVQRILVQNQHVRCLCSGSWSQKAYFHEKVIPFDACRADLGQKKSASPRPGSIFHPPLPGTPPLLRFLSKKQSGIQRPSPEERFPSSASLRSGPIFCPSSLELPPLNKFFNGHATFIVLRKLQSASRHPPASDQVQSRAPQTPPSSR